MTTYEHNVSSRRHATPPHVTNKSIVFLDMTHLRSLNIFLLQFLQNVVSFTSYFTIVSRILRLSAVSDGRSAPERSRKFDFVLEENQLYQTNRNNQPRHNTAYCFLAFKPHSSDCHEFALRQLKIARHSLLRPVCRRTQVFPTKENLGVTSVAR